MTDDEKLTELEGRLREGVSLIGIDEDNSTELFDIQDADEVMFEAADAIHTLRQRNARLVEGLRECAAELESIAHSEFDSVWAEDDFIKMVAPYRTLIEDNSNGR